MRETSKMDNLNWKMQAYVRVWEENKLKLDEYIIDCKLNFFSLKDRLSDTTLETVKKWILVCLLVMIFHSIKILILYLYTIMYVIGQYWPQSVK